MTPEMPSPDVSDDVNGSVLPPDGLDPDLTLPDTAGAALGALPIDEAGAVQDAARHDPHVAAELADMQAVVAALSLVSPTHEINRGRSAGIRSRLLSRAEASPQAVAAARRSMTSMTGMTPAREVPQHPRSDARASTLEGSRRPGSSERSERPDRRSSAAPSSREIVAPPSRERTRDTVTVSDPISDRGAAPRPVVQRSGVHPGWLALAAGLLIAVGGVQEWRILQARNVVHRTDSIQDGESAKRIATLEAAVAERDSALQSLAGQNVAIVDLINYSSREPLARMFWDRARAEWTMYVYQLRQPRPGKVFQVWLVTKNAPAPISAGTFSPDERGMAVFHAKYQLDRTALSRIAVSEESAPGAQSPTGPILIAGAER